MDNKSKTFYSVDNIPQHKRIINTKITVDCFDIPLLDCSHFFLSHFHSDHYTKLTKSFEFPVYCSKTTAMLVSSAIGAKTVGLEMYTNYDFDGFVVRLIDANHCPGAVCFIFLIDGHFILHTGDFRYDKIYHSFNIHFKAVYLDNTYENEIDFPTQKEAISKLLCKFDQKNTLCPQNICILCCGYRIGKEKIFLSIAEYLDQKIQVTQDKFEMYKCYSKYTIDKINDDVLEIVNQKRSIDKTFGFSKKVVLKTSLSSINKKSTFRKNGILLPEPNTVKYKNENIEVMENITNCRKSDISSEYSECKPFDRFTMNEAPIKVINMCDLNRLNEITSKVYADKIIVLIGSGWKEKVEYKIYNRVDGRKIKKGIEMVYFRYSEHSSPSELNEFKKTVSCDSIINTVKKT